MALPKNLNAINFGKYLFISPIKVKIVINKDPL